ncbi:MAG: hypothetical protein Q4B57_08370 [Eubacteriales bacterium]|nr:hypothetical protein [Eubacteriales bacterium]
MSRNKWKWEIRRRMYDSPMLGRRLGVVQSSFREVVRVLQGERKNTGN